MSTVPRELRLAVESIPGRREVNQDSFLAEALPDGRVLLAVADGMGGHAAGEVASALALEILRGSILDGRTLREGIELANARVNARSQDPGKTGMGTTVVAVVVDGAEYTTANVGDSRAYLIRESGIVQLTEDHSFLVEAMKRGQSEEEAMASRWRDALTRSVGIDASVQVDVFGPYAVEPDSAILLCSDGLYKTLPDGSLMDGFLRSAGVEEAVRGLVAAAYEGGSDDNITVVVGEWGEVPRQSAPSPAGEPEEAFGPAEIPAAESPEAFDSPPPSAGGDEDPFGLPGAPAATEAAAPSGPPATRTAEPDSPQGNPDLPVTDGAGAESPVGARRSSTSGVILAVVVVVVSAIAGFFLFGR